MTTINTNAEANARLIAAAPELLEALKAIIPVLNMSDSEHKDFRDSCADTVQELWAVADQIKAAIAKAEGTL